MFGSLHSIAELNTEIFHVGLLSSKNEAAPLLTEFRNKSELEVVYKQN